MGNFSSQDQKSSLNSTLSAQNHQNNINWEILQQLNFKQILKSKRTQLIVERYCYQIQESQNFDKQNKIYEWRNKNPNHQFIVNVLSVNKDQIDISGCGSSSFCPSNPIHIKVYIVTERILRLEEIQILQSLRMEMENQRPENINKPTSSNSIKDKTSKLISLSQVQSKKFKEKLKPFLTFQLSELQSKRILKDWIRGIQILCYKFGYFKVSKQLLGINLSKRGNIWMNENFALNQVDMKRKVNVNTAEQKYRYEKQTIQSVFSMIQKIEWFSLIMKKFKNYQIQKFDEFFRALDRISNESLSIEKITSPLKIHSQNRLSYDEISSLKDNRNTQTTLAEVKLPNLGLNQLKGYRQLSYDEKCIQFSPRRHSNERYSVQSSRNMILNDFMKDKSVYYNIQVNEKQRSSVNEIRQEIYVSSNHKNCGKQTAPTNQLGHSSELNSINNQSNHRPQIIYNQKQKSQVGRNLSFSQDYQKITVNESINSQKIQFQKGKMYFPQINNSLQQHMYRSQRHNYQTSENLSVNYKNTHNVSVDEINLVGPYQKDKFFKNLNKQKIALVDSMVIVQEQNEEISDDSILNVSGTRIILEESIIIRGGKDHNSSRDHIQPISRLKNH